MPDSLILSVNSVIRLHGVQHFGREGCEYTVSIEIKDTTSNLLLVKKSEAYSSEKDLDYIYYGFDVLFDTPVILESGKGYEISSMINGPPSWYSDAGQALVNFDRINFTISKSDGTTNGSSDKRGQFPVFLFIC